MKFTKEFLIASLGKDDNCTEEALREIIEMTRWSTIYRRIFKFEDKFYETFFSRGSTEYQEEYPYENEDDEIECDEVIPVEVLTISYEKVKK